MYMEQSLNLSIVIPVCNEEESIGTLVNEIDQVLERSLGYEIIVVDDGSRDATLSVLSELKQGLDQLRIGRAHV